jgi:hypothetical protein
MLAVLLVLELPSLTSAPSLSWFDG